MSNKLVFIYNANSGFVNSILDSAHKFLSPKTYKCSLCKITHSSFSEKSEWKNFKNSYKIKMEFLHKDETPLALNYKLPVILLNTNNNFKVLLNHIDLNRINNVDELIYKLKTNL